MVWYLGGRGLLMRSFYRTDASPDLCNKAFSWLNAKSPSISAGALVCYFLIFQFVLIFFTNSADLHKA